MTADAILTADWHLREDKPICRIDDYWSAQWYAVEFIRNLTQEHTKNLIHAGDLFDKPRAYPFLLLETIRKIPHMLFIPGQHDILNHNLNLLNKSNVAIIEELTSCCMLEPIKGFPYSGSLQLRNKNIAVIHTLVHETEDPVKIMGGISAKVLMKKLPDHHLIIVGDNHLPFVVKEGNQLLVNPGSMMRMSADQITHRPRVYLWYADNNEVEPVYIPIKRNVISREHIIKKQNRDEAVQTYVNSLETQYEIGLSFEKNLEKYFLMNKTDKTVETMTWKMVEN